MIDWKIVHLALALAGGAAARVAAVALGLAAVGVNDFNGGGSHWDWFGLVWFGLLVRR
ncbi:hypothetical protein CALVIDRAFT_532975 [Calocera viscosa TUFC12733]|uniref:Uncharacterized protein n=1 Tax=Calocera viscosa (strain TUFC12733) TaxID=1330018 RepID=A0A167RWT3_CALVF|nr:hypothetical protein CALVIDRAFT_532975 [Calocera viscosa TUFC12733]